MPFDFAIGDKEEFGPYSARVADAVDRVGHRSLRPAQRNGNRAYW